MRRLRRSTVYAEPAGGADLHPITPDYLGAVAWFRSDLDATTLAAKVTDWDDQADGHDMAQATDANRLDVSGTINGHDVFQADPTGAVDKFLSFDSAWAQASACSIYAVIKYNASGIFPQRFMNNSSVFGGPLLYANAGGGTPNKPQTYLAGTVALWGTALSAGDYIIKWGFSVSGSDTVLRVGVNGGTDVTQTVIGNVGRVNWTRLGTTDDIFRSGVAEFVMFNKLLSAGEQSDLYSYLNRRYEVF